MKFFLLVPLVAVACAKPTLRFDHYQVYRITPQDDQQLTALQQLGEFNPGYNFWTDVGAVGKPVDVMVPPHLRYDFEDFLQLQKLPANLSIEDVQTLVDQEQLLGRSLSESHDWKHYGTLDEIYAWLNSLEAKYPGIVATVVGGSSYEGRQILGLKISYGPDRKGVFLEGGIHANEWISPATVTYIVNQLLTSTESTVRKIAESHDWYVFPVFNPDGYEYTHTTDRMWRKTRTPNEVCVGVDLNRNWDYHWMDGGASNNSCARNFAGSKPFSEKESQSMSHYISSIANKLEIYIGFHSYGQLLMIPFGHAGLEVPTNDDEHHRIGRTAANKLAERYGTKYIVGNIPEVIYVGSGGSSDWVLGAHRDIKFVFTYELRDTGRYGFLLPPEQIIPTGEETLDSVVSILQQAAEPTME